MCRRVKKKSEVKIEILNQSPQLIVKITFLLFNYLMLTIRLVKYCSEFENLHSSKNWQNSGIITIKICTTHNIDMIYDYIRIHFNY